MKKKTGKTEEFFFYSEALDEDVKVIAYLPSSFSPLKKYSLLIAQDGRDYYMLGRTPRLLDELLDEQKISDTIFVGIPYKSVEDRRDKYHPNGSKHKAYLRFLSHEFVPYLEERYPTYQMGKSRILAGDSLAGTASLLAALAYPHSFGKVIMQSPFVNDDVLEKVKRFEHSSLLDIYHVIGLRETNVRMTDGATADFLTANRELHQIMKEEGFPLFYDEFDGEHSWKYWQPDLRRALIQMAAL